MPAKLYKLDPSPPARAAMIGCEIFNVPVEFIDVDLTAKAHLTPEFLKMNPVHTVPVFTDDKVTLHDSHAILMYLADTYADDSHFYPKDTTKRALINQKLFFNNSVLFSRMRQVTYPAFMFGVRGVQQKQLDDIEDGYKMIEEFLSRSKFLALDHITIADIEAMTTVGALYNILPIDEDKYPKLSAWVKEMESQPYIQKVNAPGAKGLADFLKIAITPES